MNSATSYALSGEQQFWLLLTSVVGALVLKLVLAFIAYRIIRMGHQLLVDGVKGEFKFKSDLRGVKADLASASPGTFFLLLGVVILVTALVVKIDVPHKQMVSEVAQGSKGTADVLPKKDPFK